jgi:hypothetical protein
LGLALPHEVAMLALFLCSDEAAFITGVDYPIDGGFFKLPVRASVDDYRRSRPSGIMILLAARDDAAK